MKHFALTTLALAVALLAPIGICRAQNLTVTISPQTQLAIRGDVVTFQGTIRNDGATPLFLNGDSIAMSLRGFQILPVAFDLQLDDSPFASGASVQLNPGQQWSGDLFRITVGIDAPQTTYDGTFAVLGGASAVPFDSLGSGPFHLTVVGTPPVAGPAAPTNLTATGAGSNIVLAWVDHASNEEGFAIEQSTDGTNYTVIGLIGADQIRYVAGPLNPNNLYFFRVRAFNGFQALTYSAYSNLAVSQVAQLPLTIIPWNAPGWAYMNPMGGPAGILPNRPNGTPDPNFLTTWFLSESDFATLYDGPTFGASPAQTGVPGNSTTYDSGVGAGTLGFAVMDYWATAGAEFTNFGTTLTTPNVNERWTGYFRRTFTIPGGGILKPTIRYLIDDGAYIYIDGILVATVNIATDPMNSGQPIADTFTQLTAAAGNEASLQTVDLSGPAGDVPTTNAHIWVSLPSISAGTHTLAISVHQTGTTSSDLGLAIELSGQRGQMVYTYATDGTAQVATADTGAFTIARTGETSNALNVNFGIASGAGQAMLGTRYALVPAGLTATIPAGSASTTIMVNPLADTSVRGAETVTLNLATGAGYDVGIPSSATVQLLDSPINIWKIQQFGSVAAAQGPSAADDASPAGDGLSNLLKYGLGLNPLVPAVSLPFANIEDFSGTTHLTLTLTRPRPVPIDVTYHFEYLSDLINGIWNAAEIVPGYPLPNGATETLKVRDPEPSAGKSKDFIRLRVTRP